MVRLPDGEKVSGAELCIRPLPVDRGGGDCTGRFFRDLDSPMLRMLLVVIVMTMVVVVTVRHLETVGRAPASVATTKPDQTPAPANSRAMVIRAGSDGHFEVDARVEGRRVAFLVDTGA